MTQKEFSNKMLILIEDIDSNEKAIIKLISDDISNGETYFTDRFLKDNLSRSVAIVNCFLQKR